MFSSWFDIYIFLIMNSKVFYYNRWLNDANRSFDDVVVVAVVLCGGANKPFDVYSQKKIFFFFI